MKPLLGTLMRDNPLLNLVYGTVLVDILSGTPLSQGIVSSGASQDDN